MLFIAHDEVNKQETLVGENSLSALNLKLGMCFENLNRTVRYVDIMSGKGEVFYPFQAIGVYCRVHYQQIEMKSFINRRN